MRYIKLILYFLPLFSGAQTSKYFVQFTDKNNSPYSIANPSAFLSQRAIDRRVNHGVAVQQNDIPVNQNYIDSVVSQGATLFTRSKWFNGVTIEADTNTLHAIQLLPFVQLVKQVKRVRSFGKERRDIDHKFELIPAPHVNPQARTQSFNYGQSFNQIHIMNGDYLHDIGFHGENMVIALLDAGFYRVDSLPAFDSLRANNQILGTWDFVDNEVSVYEDYDHGMEVLSTIAGNIPGQLVGTAPKASFWLLRTEDVFSERIIEEYNWDAGAEFADSAGADIISTSLGYTVFTNGLPGEDHSYADMNGHTTPCAQAANIAFSKGMLVIASAGNEGGGPWHYIGTPADGDSVMAVGAVDGTGAYAFFSSTGPSSDGDIKPNVAAVGQGTTISIFNGAIATGNGTSFSCPVLAGSAACLWQAFPGKSNREIFDAIQQSASQFQNPDSLMGFGIPNFMTADQILGGVDVLHFVHEQVTVFPNPFQHDVELNFYSTTDQKIMIEVMDVLGKKLFHQETGTLSGVNNLLLPLEQLQSGIYFLKLQAGENAWIKKMIKY